MVTGMKRLTGIGGLAGMKEVTAVKSARTNGRAGTPKVVQKVLADIKIPKSDIGQVLNYWKKAKMCLFEFMALLLLN